MSPGLSRHSFRCPSRSLRSFRNWGQSLYSFRSPSRRIHSFRQPGLSLYGLRSLGRSPHSFRSPGRSFHSFRSPGPFLRSFWRLNISPHSFRCPDQLIRSFRNPSPDFDRCSWRTPGQSVLSLRRGAIHSWSHRSNYFEMVFHFNFDAWNIKNVLRIFLICARARMINKTIKLIYFIYSNIVPQNGNRRRCIVRITFITKQTWPLTFLIILSIIPNTGSIPPINSSNRITTQILDLYVCPFTLT